MATTIYPTIVNCNSTGAGISTCPTKKKQFASRALAEQWEADYRKRNPEQTPQYVYSCEECDSWHLSHMSPEARQIVGSRSQSSSTAIHYHHLQKNQDKIGDILALYKQGLGFAQIAKQLGIPYHVAYNTCINQGVHVPKENPKIAEAMRSAARPLTIADLSEEEKELQSKLAELQAKKQRMIEARATKIGPTVDGQGVLIRKEGNSLPLSVDDAKELVEKLIEYLAVL